MQTGKVLLSSLVGTTAMTLFSYLVSEAKDRNFREPEVLGELVERLPASPSKKPSQMVGWFAHYAIGATFVAFYNELWKRKIVKPTVTSGALLGGASGVVGIVSWKAMFEGHPDPQRKNLKRFFGHLMLAHVVFGVFSAITYKVTPAHRKL